jgi:hypothetical protein
MIIELVYQTECVSIKVYQRVGDLSYGGLDEYIYISLFCNKSLCNLAYVLLQNIFFLS